MDKQNRQEVEANIAKLESEKTKLITETQSIAYRDMLETIKVLLLALGAVITLVVGVSKLMGS